MARAYISDEYTFWLNVDIPDGDGCWIWVGRTNRDGYGSLYFRGFTFAHRLMWHLVFGPIPEGMHVLHRCDNPPCVNPGHLWLGTPLDNARDSQAKGRGRYSKMPPKPPRIFRIRRPHTGSIAHRSDGRWQVSRQVDGKRRAWMFRSEADARAQLDRLAASVPSSSDAASSVDP